MIINRKSTIIMDEVNINAKLELFNVTTECVLTGSRRNNTYKKNKASKRINKQQGKVKRKKKFKKRKR